MAVKMPLPADGDYAGELGRLQAVMPDGFAIGYSGDWGAKRLRRLLAVHVRRENSPLDCFLFLLTLPRLGGLVGPDLGRRLASLDLLLLAIRVALAWRRDLFESVVARCIAEGLVGGTTFASDASLIRADANKQYSAPKERWDPAPIDTEIAPRAVLEYLDVLDDAAFGWRATSRRSSWPTPTRHRSGSAR